MVSDFELSVSKILLSEIVDSAIFSLFVVDSSISTFEVVYPVLITLKVFVWVVSTFEVVSLVVSEFDWVVWTFSKLVVLTSGSCISEVVLSVIISFEVLSKLKVFCLFSIDVVIGISVDFSSKEVVGIFSFSVCVLGTILLVFVIVSVVSLIIDVKISIKEVVFDSCSLTVLVDVFISVEAISLVDTDSVELLEVTIVVSLFKEVVSIKGLVVGTDVVSILEVFNDVSTTLVVSFT